MLLQAQTSYGKVEGVLSDKGYALYKGIPYAAPPVGALRWQAPQPPQPWPGIRLCNTFGPACIQGVVHTPDTFYGKEYYNHAAYPPTMSEDCLYLNLWTPAQTPEDKLPVMMWIHGGGVQNGYSHEIEFDGDAYCARNVILVTINYRLNIFGYFAHPELSAENHGCSGNYGLLDQIAALEWIRENAAAFGGDPDNITVFGQSGGARSTASMVASPLTRGKMRRAIIQSGGGLAAAWGDLTCAMLEKHGEAMAQAIGAKSLADLRDLPGEALWQKYTQQYHGDGFNICADGCALPLTAAEILRKGAHADIDCMIGSTGSESMASTAPDNRERALRMMSSQVGWLKLQLLQGKRPLYHYCFTRPMPGDASGAFHAADLWYIFGTLGHCWRPLTKADHTLSNQMLDYWTHFAKSGNPNGDGLPVWTPYTKDHPLTMRLDIENMGMYDFADPELDAQVDALLKL